MAQVLELLDGNLITPRGLCDVLDVAKGSTAGLIPVCVMVISAVVMTLCGTAMKKLGWKWMGDYALPISLVLGMASAIPITAWLG